MPDRRTDLQAQFEPSESLAELLRSRALASSPRLLIGQAVGGVALNAALLVWHPDRWGIATAAMVTVATHAVWSLAVQRTDDSDSSLSQISTRDVTADLPSLDSAGRQWWRVRHASSFVASASALLVLWFVCMMLLGRMIS